MTTAPNRRAVLGAVLAVGVCLSAPARAAIPTRQDGRVAAIAQRITGLLREREANRKAVRAAADKWDLPPTPPELLVTYRGPLGPLKVEVDPDWIREMLPNFSPLSRRGRRLQKLLRMHEEHSARVSADREASGLGALVDERARIERELEAAVTEACSLGGHGVADADMAMKLDCYHDRERAPAVLLALLEVVGTG
jgi:hypothetical protein